MKQKHLPTLFAECSKCGLHFQQQIERSLVCPRCGWREALESGDAELMEGFLRRAKQRDEEGTHEA
ncbi:hypothetical protein D7X33_08575 [Butyricicoccus sp. 1XD8-22]|nr:hypothetical protein D7X33_08575 [Butyricicoccus sp. 1XD8-22]